MRAAPTRSLLSRVLPLVLLLAAPLMAPAVEKCVSPQGKVAYSDEPCPAGWKGSAVRPPASAPPRGAAPVVTGSGGTAKPAAAASKAPATHAAVAGAAPAGVTLRYYDVQGHDFDSLLAALNAGGGFHAKAEWNLTYQYQPKRAGRACSPQPVSTQLELVMTLPRWTQTAGASPALYGRWQRYVAALRAHEEGHLQIGRDMEAALKKSLAVISERCEKLDGRVKQIFATLLERHRKRDADYDRDTMHGRTQGAEFR